MNSYEIIETAGLVIIVAVQAFFFARTRKSITVLGRIFPAGGYYEVVNYVFLKNDIKDDPRNILSNMDYYTERATSLDLSLEHGYVEAELIVSRNDAQPFTKEILRAINVYLLRNRGAVSDFHLIRDLVDSHCDVVEDDVSQSISLPLYIGLLGTFSGIVFGLFQLGGMHFSADNTQLDQAITLLLGGVKISMVASFMGLALTVANSAFGFNAAKKNLQTNRNNFYTFIKTDLLPLLNQNINSTLLSLQVNLNRFNENFGGQIEKLDGIMDRNYEALMAQDRILTTIDRMDVTSYAKANIKVLSELRITTDRLVNFNVSLDAMNGLIGHTQVLANDISSFTRNTEALATVGKDLHVMFSENKALQEFLKHHYTALDESHRLITTSVNNVYNTLDESLDNLKAFTMEKITEIRKLSLQEIDHLENKYPAKWNQLDNLSHLPRLEEQMDEMKDRQGKMLGKDLKEIGTTLEKLAKTLESIRQKQDETFFDRIWKWITGKQKSRR